MKWHEKSIADRIEDKGWASSFPPGSLESETNAEGRKVAKGTDFLIIRGCYADYLFRNDFKGKQIINNIKQKKLEEIARLYGAK